jgi:hypothetical protein
MSDPVLSDGVGISVARESAIGVQPVTGWHQWQINPGGITDFTRQNVEVDRNPLSPNLTPEDGEVVGYDVSPKLAADLTRDVFEDIREPLLRSVTKHGGNRLSLYRPTAVTSTGYTVGALGDLTAGLLIYAAGFTNPANNGLKLVAAASTGTEIKATGLVAETAPANAVVEIAGVQGASGDIQLNASGDLISTTLDFTALGLVPGQMIVIGDLTSGAAFGFATAAYNARAIVKGPITATKIPLLMRAWTVGAADTGASKTIRLLFARANRNVPLTDTDYLKAPTLSMERTEPGAGIAGATDFTQANGMGLDMAELDIPVEGKVTVTMSFKGMTISDPSAVQATGASTALAPLRAGLFSTASKLKSRLVKKSDESTLSVDMNGLKVTFKNNITPMKELGVSGASNLIYGAYEPTMSLEAYVIDNGLERAANANTSAMLDCLLKNGDGGLGIFFPVVKLRKPSKAYAQHTAVMISNDLKGVRDISTGLLQTISEFSYLP